MPRILVVDDEADALPVVATYLTAAGCEVDTAQSAEQARALLAATHYDVALIDLIMPGEGGRSLAMHVLSTAPCTVPLLMSGEVSAREAGTVAPFLAKPFERDTLLAMIERALVDSRTNRTLYRIEGAVQAHGEKIATLDAAVSQHLMENGIAQRAAAKALELAGQSVWARLAEPFRHPAVSAAGIGLFGLIGWGAWLLRDGIAIDYRELREVPMIRRDVRDLAGRVDGIDRGQKEILAEVRRQRPLTTRPPGR